VLLLLVIIASKRLGGSGEFLRIEGILLRIPFLLSGRCWNGILLRHTPSSFIHDFRSCRVSSS
jgi:hypothetical protein